MAKEFKKQFADDGPVECFACKYPGDVAEFKNMDTEYGKKDLILCEFCATTHLGTSFSFPFDKDRQLHQSIGWIANRLLDEIRKR